ncbi:AVL9-related family protein 2, partial [Hyphodiscus hymeniophilus]
MAAVRRGQGPLSLNLPSAPSSNDLPPISALFLIYFDIKAGYTIGWKRSIPGIELEGVVEYKSLPSGLHTVKEDLIYYVHDNHAGLSAFVNAPAAEESRNARMIAVGVMVPLSYGRLGRAWRHADSLKEMASKLIVDPSDTKILEEFWEEHKPRGNSNDKETDSLLDSPSTPKFQPISVTSAQPKGHGRNRSVSDGTTLLPPGQNLSAYHPAWSLPRLLETFGPLMFPIHRAALLRKRILITAHAPVEETCNFVYDLSLLSNIPLAVSDLLSTNAPPQRLRPLFSIGVHDIPLLEEDLRASKAAATTPGSENTYSRDEQGCGWIACTTDSILAMKSTLYDVLITMPPPYSDGAAEKVWPKVESPQGTEMQATQRDLRRYRALRWGLSRNESNPSSPTSARRTSTASQEERLRLTSSSSPPRDDPMLDIPDTDSIIEPLSWSALAYSGFMWWASAGEQRLHSDEEAESDSALLSGLSLSPSTPQTTRNLNRLSASSNRPEEQAKVEMGIIAYFHRMTTMILTTLSDIVDATDSDDEREEEGLTGD